jgi:hypothetical protein
MTTYYSGKNTYAVARVIPVVTVMTAHVTNTKTANLSCGAKRLHTDIRYFVRNSTILYLLSNPIQPHIAPEVTNAYATWKLSQSKFQQHVYNVAISVQVGT